MKRYYGDRHPITLKWRFITARCCYKIYKKKFDSTTEIIMNFFHKMSLESMLSFLNSSMNCVLLFIHNMMACISICSTMGRCHQKAGFEAKSHLWLWTILTHTLHPLTFWWLHYIHPAFISRSCSKYTIAFFLFSLLYFFININIKIK